MAFMSIQKSRQSQSKFHRRIRNFLSADGTGQLQMLSKIAEASCIAKCFVARVFI